jgi:4-hydroxymandelate oxidase
VIPSLEGLRAEAERQLRTDVFDYIDGGSGEEITLSEASEAWKRWRIHPRTLVDVTTVATDIALFGSPLAAPIIVAPTATHGLVHKDGEVGTARAVHDARSLLVLSTRSSCRIEAVAEHLCGQWWYQVYVMRNRDITARLVERAAAAGATAVVLTADTPYVGKKKRAGRPVGLDHPSALVNAVDHLPLDADPLHALEQDPSVVFDDIRWLADVSGLPVLIKGVLRPDDAQRSVDTGAAGIIVSNHGGRQLDRAASTAAVLPRIVHQVGDRVPILVDGGIRNGTDVLVALALGARAVLIGRPILWALATNGAAGVQQVLDTLRGDLAHAMALAGAPTLSAIEASLVEESQA